MRLLLRIRDWLWISLQAVLGRFALMFVSVVPASVRQGLIDDLTPWETDARLARIGPKGDGGYVLLSETTPPEALISLGVGGSSAFEAHFADLGVRCILVDATVEGPAQEHQNFVFESKLVGLASRGSNYVSIQQLLSRHGLSESGNLLAQIDIEGAEFEALISTSHHVLSQFRQIVVECHDMASCLTSQGKRLWDIFFEHLSETHFLVHTHANNCCPPVHVGGVNWPNVVELTFVRNDVAIRLSKSRLDANEHLDARNSPDNRWRYF